MKEDNGEGGGETREGNGRGRYARWKTKTREERGPLDSEVLGRLFCGCLGSKVNGTLAAQEKLGRLGENPSLQQGFTQQ